LGGSTTQIRKKVLVVNDDKSHLYETRDLLENEEIEVVTHTSAFGVTSLVRLMQPDLILLDINMMAQSSGKLAMLMRDYCDSCCIPVVFHSFNDETNLVECMMATNITGYAWKGILWTILKSNGISGSRQRISRSPCKGVYNMIKRKKILVVDDEMHRRITGEILRDEKFEVVTH